MNFTDNVANYGSAFACIGGNDNTFVENVTFSLDVGSVNYSEVDVYTDGSCTAYFWQSVFPCPFDCNSCNVRITILFKCKFTNFLSFRHPFVVFFTKFLMIMILAVIVIVEALRVNLL